MTSDGNGGVHISKTALTALVGAPAIVAALLGIFGGWKAGIASDAAFRQRVESHLTETVSVWDRVNRDHDVTLRNEQNILALTKQVQVLVESQQRLGDKIDLLVQSGMRRGEINR